jgi:hypothetical protein
MVSVNNYCKNIVQRNIYLELIVEYHETIGSSSALKN